MLQRPSLAEIHPEVPSVCFRPPARRAPSNSSSNDDHTRGDTSLHGSHLGSATTRRKHLRLALSSLMLTPAAVALTRPAAATPWRPLANRLEDLVVAAPPAWAAVSSVDALPDYAGPGPYQAARLPLMEHTASSVFPMCTGDRCRLRIQGFYPKGGSKVGETV
jgi:hypothetical protein